MLRKYVIEFQIDYPEEMSVTEILGIVEPMYRAKKELETIPRIEGLRIILTCPKY